MNLQKKLQLSTIKRQQAERHSNTRLIKLQNTQTQKLQPTKQTEKLQTQEVEAKGRNVKNGKNGVNETENLLHKTEIIADFTC